MQTLQISPLGKIHPILLTSSLMLLVVLTYKGVSIKAPEEFRFNGTGTKRITIKDSVISCLSTNEKISITAVNGAIDFINCNIGTNSGAIYFAYGCYRWFGGTLINTGSTNDGLEFGREGGHLECYGVDLTDATRLISLIDGESQVVHKFVRCLLPSTIRPVTWGAEQCVVEFYNCSDAADNYFEFRREEYVGTTSFDTSVYRSATYDGSNEYSVLIQPNTSVLFKQPLSFQLCEIPSVDLTSSKTVTVELAQYNAGGAPRGTSGVEMSFGFLLRALMRLIWLSVRFSHQARSRFSQPHPT